MGKEDKYLDKDGFEAWATKKKLKKKKTALVTITPENNMKGKEKMVGSSVVRQHRPVVKKSTVKSSEEL